MCALVTGVKTCALPILAEAPPMEIYLPIAGVSQDLFLILGLGAAVGLLSGMFGVGGGLLLTPLLMQLGIPPAVAVATAANQVVGASVSGCLAHSSEARRVGKEGVSKGGSRGSPYP